MRRFLLFVTVVCSCLAAVGAEVPLGIAAEGEPFRAALAGAEAAWKLRFEGGGSPREIAAADLALWGSLAEPAAGIQIILAGGGMIVADTVRIENERLRGPSQLFGELDLPLELITGIVLRPPTDRAMLDQWLARVAAPGGQTDRVLLDNGDELTGTVAGLHEKGVSLETDAGKIDVEIDKTSAIFFNPTLVHKSRPTGLRSLIGFRDGSRLTAIELLADKTSARLKLAGGAELTAPTNSIVALQPLGGRITYLSDLKPASYRHVPYLQLSWPFQADRSVLGSQLRTDGKIYAKGLGMHSPARITYDLGQAYRRFEAEVAIDAEAGPRGSVVFRVFTDDGKGEWQLRASSEIVRGGQAPVPIAVDLTGARRLSLLVDFADRGDELDHADWLNARLVR
jgi:hypothetical protein